MKKGFLDLFSRTNRAAPPIPARICSVPDDQRIYAIGDVHGSNHLLTRLLMAIGADVQSRPAKHVTLIYVGDYIDRGLGVREVIDMVRHVPAFANEVIRLKGNHEVMLDQFLAEPEFARDWRHYGGIETLAAYGVDIRKVQLGRDFASARDQLVAAMPPEHVRFFSDLQPAAVIGDYFFCHAGVRPDVPLDEQVEADLLWIREPFLTSEADFGKMVVHGHSPCEQPEVRGNRINVDTGAYATGRLTAVRIESDGFAFLSSGP